MPNTKERYGFCQEAQFYESSLLRSSSLFCKQVGAFKKATNRSVGIWDPRDTSIIKSASMPIL